MNKKKTKKTDQKKSGTSNKIVKVYSNMAYKRKAKKDAESRRKAEELAKLPKEPVKRFFARLHPKRVFKWWFSKRGQKAFLKFLAACVLIGIIFLGGLFIYYKKDLEEIQLDEMSISDTVNTYLDRNGVVLWKDTGSENYRLTVDGSEISNYMYEATVAIEDKNFYSHIGVDFTALARATLSTLTGQGVQGGSTLTQQLIKQVYFSDEAASENRGGLARKIKELILSIELERMYTKEQILTMYLNQSPYGGRRNGVESAARTYFGKSAKDLTLAESALLAAIPNNPAVLNPYNTYGNDALIERQHKVLDCMVEMGYITEDEANEAKEVAILDTIQPEASQYSDMIAPHFVLEVRSQLEEKYGIATMRAGGWTITTTLDARAQEIAEDATSAAMSQYSYLNKSDDIALVSLDVETSQVIAMVGSSDFYNETFGEVNVTTDSLIEPGSSIKPILDYAPLFMEREGINYGPGSILKDENINSLYCAGYSGSCSLKNATGQFYGNVTIRFSLGHSLNIAAVKALYINGIDNSLEIAHKLGDVSYCEGRENYGLSIAIGSGCGVKMVEHANAYASLARGGSYKDISYILEVKNSSGDVLESWSDSEGTRVVDEQVAYMLSSILSDKSARYSNFSYGTGSVGFVVPDVWTATKTGTTTTLNSAAAKDSLMESYSTAISTLVWNGNHDGSGLASDTHMVAAKAVGIYMERVHKEIYEPEGKWSYGDEPTKPYGIQTLTVNGQTDIWPSWFNASKNSGVTKTTLVFNKYNGLLATECTAEDYKTSIEVTKVTDPMTGKEVYSGLPDGYDYETKDTCDYSAPTVSISINGSNIIVSTAEGSKSISSYTLYINGSEYGTATVNAAGVITNYTIDGTETSVQVSATDAAGYTATSNQINLTPKKTDSSSSSTKSNE